MMCKKIETDDNNVTIKFQNEDELPENISDEVYSAMFKCSHVNFVRLFPYIEDCGEKYYLVLPEDTCEWKLLDKEKPEIDQECLVVVNGKVRCVTYDFWCPMSSEKRIDKWICYRDPQRIVYLEYPVMWWRPMPTIPDVFTGVIQWPLTCTGKVGDERIS